MRAPALPVLGLRPPSGALLSRGVLLGMLLSSSVQAVDIPPLPELSEAIATAHPELVQKRAALLTERATLKDRSKQQTEACGAIEEGSAAETRCAGALEVLGADVARHVGASRRFIGALEGARMIMSMNALALRLSWTAAERTRLDKALKSLAADGDDDATVAQIQRAWQDILARDGGDLAKEAAGGAGPGFPGAGEQTRFQDCAVFALANAAGLPHGVVGARAAGLLRDGEWRDAAARANPQQVIEQRGLMGGEVIMLAEALGQVEVVPSTQFAKTLEQGRPVMINVVPESGTGGHEVVLTRAFQHGGATWFELMDSNQGPLRRLYVSAAELGTILQENGVAFRPSRGTTPKLLH